jgi:hypothetical protein
MKNQCPNCPLSFQRKEHLLRHSFVHSGIKPFVCSICSRGFSRQDALTRHGKVHQKKPTIVTKEYLPISPKETTPTCIWSAIQSKSPLYIPTPCPSPLLSSKDVQVALELIEMSKVKEFSIQNLIN